MDKVIGGTPKTKPALCNTCEYGLIAKGLNFEKLALCTQGMGQPVQIQFHVVECSKYHDKTQPSEYEMEKIAWTVRTEPRGPKGFVGGHTEVVISPPKPKHDE